MSDDDDNDDMITCRQGKPMVASEALQGPPRIGCARRCIGQLHILCHLYTCTQARRCNVCTTWTGHAGVSYNDYGQTLFLDGILMDIMIDNGQIWCKLSALVMVYIH